MRIMFLHFVALLLLRPSAVSGVDQCETLVSNKPAVLVTRLQGEAVFAIELEYIVGHAHRIESWDVTDEDGKYVSPAASLSYNDIFKFSPSDCDKTSYTVGITARCGTSQEYVKLTLDTITLEPIPIDQMATFDVKNYAQLRGQKVVAGQSATMTCQTAEDANRLYGDSWKPIYVWFKAESFKSGQKEVFAGPSESNTLVLDSTTCSDAGHYYCKVRRCSYHSTNTSACNNNDLAIQLPSPPPVTTKKCRVFGDPHVITFDGSVYDYRGECWYVLALDPVNYKWFIYGWFAPCGTRSSCLETVSIVARTSEHPEGTQIQMLRGYAMNIQGEKTFIKRDELKIVNGIELLFTGDKLKLAIPEFGLSFKFDGLTTITITVNKDTPTLGICGDNDGDKSNDYSSFYDGKERTSDAFVDAWSLGVGTGSCLLSSDITEEVLEPITSLAQLLQLRANPNYFPTEYLEDFCKKTYVGFNKVANQLKAVVDQLPSETVDYFIQACVQDTKLIDYGYFDKRYSFAGCTIATMLAEEAEELGVCIEEWQAGAKCPTREKMRNEAIRIGCVWTEEDFNIVTS